MSRPRDLVGLAMGNVRVPVTELTMEERLKLFHVFGAMIGRHYSTGSRGGSAFKDWSEQTYSQYMLNDSDMKGEAEGLKLANKHMPWVNGSREYSAKAVRIVILASQMFNLPAYGQYFPTHWEKGAYLGFSRLCLTQDGLLCFEWFEAIVDDKLQGNVTKAEYQLVPVSLEHSTDPLPARLMTLLEVAPSFIDRFFYVILELIDSEATAREQRAKRDRDLSNRLSEIGKMFDISIVHP